MAYALGLVLNVQVVRPVPSSAIFLQLSNFFIELLRKGPNSVAAREFSFIFSIVKVNNKPEISLGKSLT